MPLADNRIKIQTLLDGINALPEAIKLQEKTTTPTLEAQVISPDSGYGGLSKVIVNAMPTATQAIPSISVTSNGLITASARQTAGYVSAGTKSMTQQLTTQAAQTITPGTSDKTIASGRYLTGTQTIKGDANLLAENIAEGVSIFGVLGTLEEGGLPDGVSALASGTFTPASNSLIVQVTHNLGVVPNFAVCLLEADVSTNTLTSATVGTATLHKNAGGQNVAMMRFQFNGSGLPGAASGSAASIGGVTTTRYLFMNEDQPFMTGYTYRWVCGVMDGIN